MSRRQPAKPSPMLVFYLCGGSNKDSVHNLMLSYMTWARYMFTISVRIKCNTQSYIVTFQMQTSSFLYPKLTSLEQQQVSNVV